MPGLLPLLSGRVLLSAAVASHTAIAPAGIVLLEAEEPELLVLFAVVLLQQSVSIF